MKIEVNINKKYFYTIVALLIIIGGVFVVYAFGTNDPATFGHSMGELAPPSGCNGYLKYSGGVWTCDTPSGGGGGPYNQADYYDEIASINYASNTLGRSIKILDINKIDELCKDNDGCQIILGQRYNAGANLGAIYSTPYFLMYISQINDFKWYNTGTAPSQGTMLTDGSTNNQVELRYQGPGYGCTFSDSDIISTSPLAGEPKDTTRGFSLINFQSKTDALNNPSPNNDITCFINIID